MSLTHHTFATYLFMSSADDIMQGKGKVPNLTKNKFLSCLLLLPTFQLKCIGWFSPIVANFQQTLKIADFFPVVTA